MAIKIGLEAKLFYGTAGSQASTEAKNVKDVTLSLEAGSADITTRAANGWRVKKATLKEGSLEFGMNYLAFSPSSSLPSCLSFPHLFFSSLLSSSLSPSFCSKTQFKSRSFVSQNSYVTMS